jgi:hypothetical protein
VSHLATCFNMSMHRVHGMESLAFTCMYVSFHKSNHMFIHLGSRARARLAHQCQSACSAALHALTPPPRSSRRPETAVDMHRSLQRRNCQACSSAPVWLGEWRNCGRIGQRCMGRRPKQCTRTTKSRGASATATLSAAIPQGVQWLRRALRQSCPHWKFQMCKRLVQSHTQDREHHRLGVAKVQITQIPQQLHDQLLQ